MIVVKMEGGEDSKVGLDETYQETEKVRCFLAEEELTC